MRRPKFVSEENRQRMSWKEQDYIYMISEGRFTKEHIKRRLYITSDVGLWKIRKRVLKYINKVNLQGE